MLCLLVEEFCKITKVSCDRAIEAEGRERQESDRTSDGGLWRKKGGKSTNAMNTYILKL